MNEKVEQKQERDISDSRLPYVRPDLVEAGKIADITLSNGNDSGGDSAYS